MFRFFFKQERCKDEKLQSKYACADQPSAPGCRTDGAINRCMGSVSATSGPDTELQVPDENLQKFGMKTSFSKDVPKLPIINDLIVLHLLGIYFILFIYLVWKKKNPRYRDSNSRPNASKGYEPNELPGKKKEKNITTENKIKDKKKHLTVVDPETLFMNNSKLIYCPKTCIA